MTDQQLLERITVNDAVMVGKPVINGTRLTVKFILSLLAHGSSVEDILTEYDGLSEEDVRACLLFATKSLQETAFKYKQLTTGRKHFWTAYQGFRDEFDLENLDIGPDVFADVRDKTAGREVVL